MKIINKLAIGAIMVGLLITSSPVFAATTPSFGLSDSYAVLASTFTNTTPTTITGDVGFTTGPAVTPSGVHPNYGSAVPYSSAGTDQATAAGALGAQSCTFTFPAGAINLSTDLSHGALGIYTPGVYCSAGAMDIAGTITLSGSGTYIFRPGGALTSAVGASVILSGASVCDVFWTPTEAVTLAANTTFLGTVIDEAGITVGANTTWTGRALAFGGTITTDTNTISAPTACAVASTVLTTPTTTPTIVTPTIVTPTIVTTTIVTTTPTIVTPTIVTVPIVTPPSIVITVPITSASNYNTITVIKQVINDNGGTAVYTDFPLFINGNPTQSGQSQSLASGIYTVTEKNSTGYATTFAGNCDANGRINHGGSGTSNNVCSVINNDIEVAPTIVAVSPIEPIAKIAAIKEPLILTISPEPTFYKAQAVLGVKIPTFPDTGFRPPEIDEFWRIFSAIIITLVLTPFILILVEQSSSSRQ